MNEDIKYQFNMRRGAITLVPDLPDLLSLVVNKTSFRNNFAQ